MNKLLAGILLIFLFGMVCLYSESLIAKETKKICLDLLPIEIELLADQLNIQWGQGVAVITKDGKPIMLYPLPTFVNVEKEYNLPPEPQFKAPEIGASVYRIQRQNNTILYLVDIRPKMLFFLINSSGAVEVDKDIESLIFGMRFSNCKK